MNGAFDASSHGFTDSQPGADFGCVDWSFAGHGGMICNLLEVRGSVLVETKNVEAMNNNMVELTEANFETEVLSAAVPVVVDFYTPWCGPCKMIAPAVDEIAKKYEGKLRVGKMDVDSEPNTPETYGIQGIPTLILFKGGQPVAQVVGYRTKDQLDAAIAKHLQAEKA